MPFCIRHSEMKYARVRISSSVIAARPLAGDGSAVLGRGLRPIADLRGNASRVLAPPFTLPVDFARAFFAAAGLTEAELPTPLLESIPGVVGLASGVVVSFVFFEFFAIYFCLGSAKPLPAERERASGKVTKKSTRHNPGNPNHEALCF
jgi:hypothetical protein